MIRVSKVSKTYLIWRTPAARLIVPIAHRLVRPLFPDWYAEWSQQQCQPVEALSDVSFELAQGDSLGIIGLNGSGKSTLLQVIAGTVLPTNGSVEVQGRIAALLELGSGFDPEFTGRENVYLNGAILGLTDREIDARYDDIVAFADIGDFIDRQVKTYSSGMVIRLAFAVQVHVDPEILIVDEALAVGDARFQARALTRIEQILERGTTLLFVGHDLNTVKSFCNRAILLEQGRVVTEGLPDDVIADYLQRVQAENRQSLAGASAATAPTAQYGVVAACINGQHEHVALAYDDEAVIEAQVVVEPEVAAPQVIVDLIDAKGLQLTGRRIPVPGPGRHTLRIGMRCSFEKGIYRFRFRLVSSPTLEKTLLVSRHDGLLSMEMLTDVRAQFTGLFPVPLEIDWR